MTVQADQRDAEQRVVMGQRLADAGCRFGHDARIERTLEDEFLERSTVGGLGQDRPEDVELHCGARDAAESRAVDRLLDSLTRVDLSEGIARRAVELRNALRLKLPDAVVLASAEVEGCILVTRNRRDFPADDPRVRFPYAL